MIFRSSLALALLLVVLAVILLGVVASPAGNRYLVRRAELALAPALEVTGVSGSILGTLCAEQVVYHHERVDVTVEEACVDPRLWESLDFLRISLARVSARAVDIRTHEVEGADETDDGEPFRSPLVVEVSDLTVGHLSVNGAEIEEVAGEVLLEGNGVVAAGALTYAGRAARIATSGSWQAFAVELTSVGVSATAVADLTAGDLPYQLTLAWQRLDLGQFDLRPLVLTEGEIRAEGNLEGYRFSGSVGVRDAVGSGRLVAEGAGDWSGLSLSRATVSDGRLAAVDLAVEQLDTTVAVRWADGVSVGFGRAEASGAFRGWPLTAELGSAKVGSDGVVLEAAVLRPGAELAGAELAGSGTISAEGRIELRASARRLAVGGLDPRFGGRADADVTVTGSIEAPDLAGSFLVSEPAFAQYRATELGGQLRGGARSGHLDVRLHEPRGSLEVTLDYRQIEGGLELELAELAAELLESPAGPLQARLDEPVTVAVGFAGGSIEVGEACITLRASSSDALQPAALCGSGRYPAGPVRLSVVPWTLPELRFADGRLTLTGGVAGDLAVESFEPLAGTAVVRFIDLTAHHPDVTPLALGPVEISAQLAADRATARVSSRAGESLLLDGELAAALTSPVGDSALEGYLLLELDGIWAAEAVLPMDVAYELDRIRGVLALDTQVAGTLGEPLLSGRLLIRDGGWEVLALNASFSDVQLEAALSESDALRFESHASLGDGSVALNGTLEALAGGDPRLSATLRLDRAEVVDLPDYAAVVDGELTLGMDQRHLDLRGELHFPEALIRIAELPQSAVAVSEDEVLVGEGEALAYQQIRSTELSISLGDRVQLDAFGLTGRLQGKLNVRERPGKPREVSGSISVREGVFEAYGQELKVERGQLNFIGPIDDPAVDVVASRVVSYEDRDYKISLHITGTAKALTTTVTSSPALAEDDALALLITGRTFSQISQSEQTNVYGAAISLGLFGASRITQNVASRVGLEEIIIDQDAEGNVEVGAALRLTSDIYLRYTYGVFSRLGGVLLRYRLNNRLSVQAKTGDAHSIELRFGVDD